jgi:two-component system, NtrC family, sensor histidine kinase HydH
MLETFPRRADARLFVTVALAAAVLGAVAITGSLQYVGRTFPGFVVWDNLLVVAVGRAGWTGTRADVPLRSRVVEVDGQPVESREELHAVLAATPPGTVHRYGFETRHGDETRTIASMRFGAGDWVVTMGVYVVNGLVFVLTGLAVFYLKPESAQSRAVLPFGVLWGLALLILAVDLWTAGRLQYLYVLLEPVVPVAVLHLARRFPEVRGSGRRTLGWLYGLGLLVGAVQVWAFWHAFPLLVAVGNVVNLSIGASGIVAIGSIAVAAFGRRATPLARRRARIVLAGAVAAFGISIPGYLAFFLFGEPVSTNLLIGTGFIFPLAIGYAVVRHDLFEADRFVKQSLVYATLTALVAVAYGGAVVLSDRLVADTVRQSPLFPIVFVIVMLVTLVPLRERVQRAVDRLFFRERIDFKTTIARASEHMTTLLDRDAIVRHVTAMLHDVLHLEGVGVWERDAAGLVGGADGALARVPASDPALATLEGVGRALSLDEIEESPRLRPEREGLRRLLATLDATLVVPLLQEGRPMGWLSVRGKASGGALSADDLDVLRTLANEAAIALGNARAVEELAEARVRLLHSERLAAIGELSAAVAHGIRNPLAGIRLAAQLGLEGVQPGEAVRENLEDVLTEVDKLEAQVRGILDFARPFEPRLEAVDVLALVGSTLDTLRARLEEARVTVDVSAAPDLPHVLADRAHLGQALHELLANAIDAMPDGGHVSIEAHGAENGRPVVQIAVGDSGPGVPAEIRDRIFQLFMTTKRTGTGVGLAVVRKILERHGGRILLDDGPGAGARFVIELPTA